MDLSELQEKGSTYFVIFGLGLVGLAWFLFRPRDPESKFKLREAERLKNQKSGGFKPSQKKKSEPLMLEGIRLDVEPHVLLNVSFNASKSEIMKSYRDLMKRYHPDKVGRPGTPEWMDAQRIAESINRAKDELLARLGD